MRSVEQWQEEQTEVSQSGLELRASIKAKAEQFEVAKFWELGSYFVSTFSSFSHSFWLCHHAFLCIFFFSIINNAAFDKKSKSSSGISTLRAHIFSDSVAELNTLLMEYMDQLSVV
jgi:hypothetical protein